MSPAVSIIEPLDGPDWRTKRRTTLLQRSKHHGRHVSRVMNKAMSRYDGTSDVAGQLGRKFDFRNHPWLPTLPD